MWNERQLQDYTRKQAKKFGVAYYKLVCVGRTGFPDVMLAYKGACVFIELKSPSWHGKVSKRQQFIIDELTGEGMEVYVTSDTTKIDAIITQLTKRNSRALH